MDFREYSAAFHAKNDDVLHFGILGMKWGIRRYQNKDGSLTEAGKKRYGQRLDSLSDDYFNKEQKENDEGEKFYKNHKRYQELYKKGNSLDDNEYAELEKITQVEAYKALEKFRNDTADSRNKIYDEFLKINNGNKRKAFESTNNFIESKRIDKRNKQSTDAVKESGFSRDEYDDFVKKVDVKDSNGRNKKIEFSVDQDNDSIKDDKGDLKRSVNDFSKNFSEHEKAIRSQIKKDLYERIEKYNYNDEDKKYFKKMAERMGKGYFNVRYIGPDDFQIYVDDGVDDWFLPSFEYDAKHKKIIGGVALDD